MYYPYINYKPRYGRDRYYPNYRDYYLYSIINSQIANTNQYLYNLGYMNNVYQNSYTNQILGWRI